MKPKLSNPILLSISRDLRSGRSLWAVLRLNEYLEPAEPLRIAFCKRAFREEVAPPMVRAALSAGRTLSELSLEERQELWRALRSEPALPDRRFHFVPKNRSRRNRHITQLVQSTPTRRAEKMIFFGS